MINYDVTKENINNSNWPQIPDHPYRIFIIRGFGSGKTKALFNLIKKQNDNSCVINEVYLNVKDPNEAKYQHLINKRKKDLTEYSNNIQDVYKNIKEYKPSRKYVLIVLDDMIADIVSNKKLNRVVTELSLRGRKLNISTVFITQTYFPVPKDVRLNCTHILLSTFQISESFNKSQLIIHEILILKTILIFTKNVLQKHIHF